MLSMGIAAMSLSVDGLSPHQLHHTSQWFLREETLKAANATLINYHHGLKLTSVWGSGQTSSSDGQRFGVQASSFLAAVSPRYFGYYDRALTVYTHVSDQFSVFSTQAISCQPRASDQKKTSQKRFWSLIFYESFRTFVGLDPPWLATCILAE